MGEADAGVVGGRHRSSVLAQRQEPLSGSWEVSGIAAAQPVTRGARAPQTMIVRVRVAGGVAEPLLERGADRQVGGGPARGRG